MANAYNRLAVANRTDAVEVELYAVPASTELIGLLYVNNRDSSSGSFSVAFTDTAGAAAAEDWVVSDFGYFLPNITVKLRVFLGAGCTIRVKGSAGGDVNFILTGMLKT